MPYPNLFTITGPQSPSVLSNMPVSIEQHVEWITECIAHMGRNKLATIEATAQAQSAWGAHVTEVVDSTLMPGTNSWYMGANIAGKPRRFLPYLCPEGLGGYRRKCAGVAESGYEGFVFAEPRSRRNRPQSCRVDAAGSRPGGRARCRKLPAWHSLEKLWAHVRDTAEEQMISRCPLWVNRVGFVMSPACPVYPRLCCKTPRREARRGNNRI